MTLRYHQPIFDLLEVEPIVDTNRLSEIAAIETAYNIQLPEAVKEYFLIANMLDTLFEFSVFMEVNPLYSFGKLDFYNGLDEHHSELVKSRKVIPLFCEHNRQWTWFLNLKNKAADPKVLLHTTDFPDMLISHPHKFAKQLYLSVWDALVMQPQLSHYYLKANHISPSTRTLQTLRLTMREISTSFIMVANETTYRFQKQDIFIAIVDNGQTSQWYFYAKDLERLDSMLNIVQKIKGLIPKIEPIINDFDSVTKQEKQIKIERILEKYS